MPKFIEIGNILFETTGLTISKNNPEYKNGFIVNIENHVRIINENFDTKEERDDRYEELKRILIGEERC